MTCAEGERHDLPARMAAELLIVDGWNVVHLGSPTSAAELSTYLAAIDADVVGVSATVTTSLPGAARSVAVARRLGCTVVVGGAAFGHGPRRAKAIGAHGWVADVSTGLDLDEVCWSDPVEIDVDPRRSWSDFEERRADVVSDAIGWIAVNHDTDLLRSSSWLDAVVHEIETVVDTVTAGLAVDDPSVVAEHHVWLARVDAAGGTGALGVGVYDALARVLHQHSVPALRMVESALAAGAPR